MIVTPTPLPPSWPASPPCLQVRPWSSRHLSVFAKAAATRVGVGGRCSRYSERCREEVDETHQPCLLCQACPYKKKNICQYPPFLSPTIPNSTTDSPFYMPPLPRCLDFQRRPTQTHPPLLLSSAAPPIVPRLTGGQYSK